MLKQGFNRPLPNKKNCKSGWINERWSRQKNHENKIIICWIKSKNLQLLLNSCGSENEKAKDTRECVIKRKIKFENQRNCLEASQLENKINHLKK